MERAIATAESEFARRRLGAIAPRVPRRAPPRRYVDPTHPEWDAFDHALALERSRQQQTDPPLADRERNLPSPPSWWKGDEDAARSSRLAMQQLRRGK